MSKRRVTLGPLTMSNVNSRASLGGGGFAHDSNRRKSTISSNASRLPDPRNITDKAVMNSSIRKLSDYLIAHGFEGPVSPKILITPSTKDFCNIVAFLFKQLDPNYKFTGKLEDEFITMFKFLGYPFPIAKSSISAVGSPHAWPTLLACLTWLLEILQYNQLSNDAELHEEQHDSDPSSSEKGFYSYLGRAYQMFLSGKDEQYDQLERQFIKLFEDKDILVIDQIEALDKRNGAIIAEIEQVKNRSAYLPELVAKKKEFQVAHTQFSTLVDELTTVRKQIYDKVEARKYELKNLNNNILQLDEKISSMRNIIQNQDLSPEDVLNLVNERKRLEDANIQAFESRHIILNSIKELETNLRNNVLILEENVKKYHILAENLKLIPLNARNSRGLDLTIEIDIRAKKRDGLLKTEINNHIIPTLYQMKAELNETTYDLRNEIIKNEEILSEIDVSRNEYNEIITTMEAKLRRIEVNYKHEKEIFDQNVTIHSKEMDTMENRLMQLRDTNITEATLTSLKRLIAENNSIRIGRKNEHDKKIKLMKESIMEVVSQCADHREMVQNQLEELKSNYSQRLQVLLSQQSPTSQTGLEDNSTAYYYGNDSILSEGMEY